MSAHVYTETLIQFRGHLSLLGFVGEPLVSTYKPWIGEFSSHSNLFKILFIYLFLFLRLLRGAVPSLL